MYRQVGLVLRKYRSGKIPKAFKVLPSLSSWEQVTMFILLHVVFDLYAICMVIFIYFYVKEIYFFEKDIFRNIY